MRLLPATLFGRLVLVLLGVLLAAQLIGAAILLRDRGVALYEASGLYAAQRIAGVVQLLDTLDASQRELILRAVNTPVFRVALGRAELPEPAPDDVHSAHLRSLLQRALGEDRAIDVAVVRPESAREQPDWSVLEHRRHFTRAHAPRGTAFFVQAQLRDGAWVSFAQRLPREPFTWPRRLLLALGVLLLSVIAVSLVAVRWATRPLRVLSDAADALGRDIDRPPLAETGPVEVRRAAQAFNAMQARLQRYVRDRERLLAAVSHDLKTPITRLRLRAELLGDEALKAKFLRDLEDMEAMASSTLEFMRTAREREPVQPIDIGALLESLQADREEMGQRVTIAGAAAQPYRGRPLALKRALANLIDNAIKYGTRADVHVDDTRERLRIVVSDAGPGIPEAQLAAVFEPFHRLELSRSRETGGVGLGLSIARDVAQAHGGDLVLRNRAGGGLDAVLTLPRAA